MNGHRLEVADVFREHETDFFEHYGDSLSIDQRRAYEAIVTCRTQALGGHVEQCNACGFERIAYNSCRNRHCPKCQASARAKWTNARTEELLPIPYFHVVFTLPQEIGPIALQNQRVVYGILFRAAAETLQELAADPKHLGAEIGVLSVLHTWGQTLVYHPHLHCVVTGGGLSFDHTEWIPCKRSGKKKKRFFIHVKILGKVFRGKFIDFLKQAYEQGDLQFHGQIARLAKASAFENYLHRSVRHDWVVYSKRPFESATPVLKYLARYTHRVAISNSRLIDMENGKVRFHWKDYAHGGKQKIMKLEANEFIRRFLLHIVPNGFMRIRYYGFLANRFRKEKLELCRQLLGVEPVKAVEATEVVGSPASDSPTEATSQERRCPKCEQGVMEVVERFPRQRRAQPGSSHSPRSPPLARSA
jgi:hypothetical protein